jgi:hypothetical protein
MKTANIFLAILLLTAGCGGNRQVNETDGFITVDVTASYPKKELILQDFMDVEYIPLETSRDFLCQGIVRDIGNNFIIVTNHLDINDGDIFIFDRNGKGLRKINRKGRGGEEYGYISELILDEDNEELFVFHGSAKTTMVYDLFGYFKRSLRHERNANYKNIYNYDGNSLICYDGIDWNPDIEPKFVIISKQDGSVIREIQISYKQKKSTSIVRSEGRGRSVSISLYFTVIPYRDSWILMEPSSDTLYRVLPDYSMIPFMARTPSIQSMHPEEFLYPGILTNRYFFMKTEKKEFDPATRHEFSSTHIMYDRQENGIFEYNVYNDDYTNKKSVSMFRKTVNNDEIAFTLKIEADELVEDYEKGILKGKLKEIAAKLKEEDNPVIMLVKHKK